MSKSHQWVTRSHSVRVTLPRTAEPDLIRACRELDESLRTSQTVGSKTASYSRALEQILDAGDGQGPSGLRSCVPHMCRQVDQLGLAIESIAQSRRGEGCIR